MALISAGTPIHRRMGRVSSSPKAVRNSPEITATRIEVWTALRTPCRSCWPMNLEITTLAPREMPTNRLRSREIIEVLLPTAAMASFPTKRPTTATSAALKSCCRIPVKASGRANQTSRGPMGPFSMSMLRERLMGRILVW